MGSGLEKRDARLQGRALPQAVGTEQVHMALLLLDDRLELQAEDLGHGGEIEEVLAHLGLHRVSALLAQPARDVRFHRPDGILEGPVGGEGLLARVYLDAAALGRSLGHSPLEPGLGLLELGRQVEDAAMADELAVDGLLEGGKVHGT